MYYKLEVGEVYTLTKFTENKWIKFIVADEKRDNYGFLQKWNVHVLDSYGFPAEFKKNSTAYIQHNNSIINKDRYALKQHDATVNPADKKTAQALINHMLKHEAVNLGNKEWFKELCKEDKNMLA